MASYKYQKATLETTTSESKPHFGMKIGNEVKVYWKTSGAHVHDVKQTEMCIRLAKTYSGTTWSTHGSFSHGEPSGENTIEITL